MRSLQSKAIYYTIRHHSPIIRRNSSHTTTNNSLEDRMQWNFPVYVGTHHVFPSDPGCLGDVHERGHEARTTSFLGLKQTKKNSIRVTRSSASQNGHEKKTVFPLGPHLLVLTPRTFRARASRVTCVSQVYAHELVEPRWKKITAVKWSPEV